MLSTEKQHLERVISLTNFWKCSRDTRTDIGVWMFWNLVLSVGDMTAMRRSIYLRGMQRPGLRFSHYTNIYYSNGYLVTNRTISKSLNILIGYQLWNTCREISTLVNLQPHSLHLYRHLVVICMLFLQNKRKYLIYYSLGVRTSSLLEAIYFW